MSNGKSIRLYNVFREVGSDYHLTIDELYLYSILRRLINYNSETLVTIDLIDQFTRLYSNVQFHSRQRESRQLIKNLLLSLNEKGVIETDGTLSGKSNQLFKITFIEMSTLGGYESIHFSDFDSIQDKTLFYIYFVVASWKGNGAFISSYNRWGEILNMTPTTAKKYVDNAVEKGIIYCNVGDYSEDEIRNGQKTRNPNQYSIYPFKEDEKSNTQRKIDNQPTSSSFVEHETDNHDYPFDTGNWLSRNNLTVDDYVIYLQHKDKTDSKSLDFIADCNKRINTLNKNGKYDYIHQKLMAEAKELLKEHEQHNHHERLQKADTIINNTGDVALLVEDEVISYRSWNKQDEVKEVYYSYGKWVQAVDDIVYDTYSKSINNHNEIEKYRPDELGDWADEFSQFITQQNDENIVFDPTE